MSKFFLILVRFFAPSALLLCRLAFAAVDTVTIYEVDGVTQTNRPITFGRVFAQGEFPQCVQPTVAGVPIASYQADVKNRWSDGSIKFAIISATYTLAAHSATTFGFVQNASCNNTGFLTQAQIASFNGGNWGADVEITASGITQAADAKSMIAAQDPALNTDCGVRYWLQGPVVTAVIAEDCTGTSAYDIGFKDQATTTLTQSIGTGDTTFTLSYGLDLAAGSIITVNSEQMCIGSSTASSVTLASSGCAFNSANGRGVNGTAAAGHSRGAFSRTTGITVPTWEAAPALAYKSIHPVFSLYFIPSQNIVKISCVLDNGWIGRVQDQKYSAAYKSGSPLTTQLSIGTFTHAAETWFRKEYWSGAAPGQIRIDHNLPYMISTMALPNYDLANSQAIPDSDYAAFIGGDKGNVTPGGSMGHGIALQDQGGNNEGAPLQREELLYLYNMGTCGNANSRCAKAWYILTGLRGAIDTTLAASVAGGAGMWNVAPTNTYFRDNGSSRGGGGCANFYCASYEDKNALNSAPASGGSGSIIGHPVSIMHQPTDVLQGHTLVNDTVVGDWSMAGWGMENSCAHWAYDYSFTAYLLTGEPWYITPVQEAGATCLVDYHNSGTGNHQSNVWFGFANMDGLNVVRAFAWSMQAVDRAAFVTPDSDTAYQNYFLAMLKSNYEILEGFFNITGTALTPTSPPPNTSCAGYNAAAATRWDWGHCTLGLNTNPGVSAGFTPGTGAGVPQPRVVTAMNTANPIVVTTDSDPTAGGVGNGGGFTIYGAPAGCPNSTYTISAINAITKQVTLSGFNGSGCSYAGGATWSTGHLRDNNTSSYEVPWQNHMATVATALIAEHGRTFTQPVLKQVLKRYVEWALASDANPYWISLYIGPVKSGAGTGSDSTSPYFTTWSGYATGMPTANVLLNVFCSWTATAANCRNADGAAPNTQMPNPPIGNFPNADHAYSLTGRAAASFAQFFNVTSSYAQCPGGTCSPAAAWAVYNHIVPFGLGIGGGNSAMVNDTLNFPSGAYITGFDANIKWALAPRLLAPAGGSSVTGSQSLSGSTRIQ